MKTKLRSLLVACGALGGLWASDPALAQKSGGVLRMPLGTSIASVSIHEESTIVVLGPMMGVFNNLVMFDQHVPQNTLSSIVSDLASSWSWSEDGKEMTFKLRDGVKWHDGKPFTAAGVKCTWDLITGKSTERILIGGRRTALPRHQTLRATLDWSYELLSEPERVILRRIGVFAGPFTLEAAGAVAASPGLAAPDVIEGLTSLVAKSLVAVEVEGGAV